jgi:methyl-accepting chemotaxis protein
MNIRSKIILSTVTGAAVTAMTLAVIAALNIKSVAAIAAVVSAFCATAVVIGLYIANSIAKPLDAAARIIREMNRLCLGSRFNLKHGDELGAMVKALNVLRQTTEAASQAPSANDMEEVSRGIADISLMADLNADINRQAKLLSTEAFTAAITGEAAMKRMAKAISWIKASSDNNAKIIKTVNYMAFRASVLAFNAVIEAERADAADNGFISVANEMRNFALRCSTAAKNITDMIEESGKEICDGVKITEDVVRYINKIVDRTDSLDRLIDKIVVATGEQAQSVQQVKTAVARINQAAQRNAAAPDAPAVAAEKPCSQLRKLAKPADDSAPKTYNAPRADDQRERRGLSDRKTRYAAFPYKGTFSATTLAFWAPERVEAEEAFTIDDCEKWR